MYGLGTSTGSADPEPGDVGTLGDVLGEGGHGARGAATVAWALVVEYPFPVQCLPTSPCPPSGHRHRHQFSRMVATAETAGGPG